MLEAFHGSKELDFESLGALNASLQFSSDMVHGPIPTLELTTTKDSVWSVERNSINYSYDFCIKRKDKSAIRKSIRLKFIIQST